MHAFLTADRPQDVFQFALDRVSPLVGAAFASIYTIADDDDVMRLAASYNWPERFRPFLGEMRVRVGLGPSGQAAGERRAIHVPDVFADPSLSDWQEVATELGFRALVALPLQTPARVLGAVTFYFAKPGQFAVEERGLLQIVADQMAATAEKASMIDDLRRANGALLESNAQLEQQYVAVMEARRLKDEFLSNISHELRTPLTALLGYAYLLQEEMSGPLTGEQRNTLAHMTTSSERLLVLIEDLLELTALRRGEVRVQVELFDPRAALEAALERRTASAPRGSRCASRFRRGRRGGCAAIVRRSSRFCRSCSATRTSSRRRERCARRCRCSTISRASPYRTRESEFRPRRSSSCSMSSARSTDRPRGSTAAPALALRSRGIWRGCWAATSSSSRRPGRGRRSWWRSR